MGLENVPLSNHRPFSANHRTSLFGLFRKEGRRRRAKRRREREREGEWERFHEPLGEDNLTIRGKGRCCTRRCAIRFYYGNARLVSKRGVVGGGFRVVVSGRGRIQPCATPVRFRNIAANLAPQNELLKPGPPLQFSVTIVTLFRCLVETC